MNPVYQSGEDVFIRPHTFHNAYDEGRLSKFIRYMAGEEYAVVEVAGTGQYLRVPVDDLSY